MNKDIRLSVSFFQHKKTIKLQRRLGDKGILALQKLWIYTAINKPNGNLAGYDAEEIAISAGWNEDADVFVQILLDLNWLDKTDEGYSIHNWQKHNSYACFAEERSEKAKKAINTRWSKKNILNDTQSNTTSINENILNDTQSNTTEYVEKYPSPSILSYSPTITAKAVVSSELQKSSEPQATILTIPLISKDKKTGEHLEFGISQTDIDNWQESFPAVDVFQELRKIKEWNIANPTRRKTEKGIKSHIVGWLSKEQDKGGNYNNKHNGDKNNGKSKVNFTGNDTGENIWNFPQPEWARDA